MILHGYFRSAAAFRVRIALNMKGLDVDHHYVHLRHREQRSREFLNINRQGLVPALGVNGAVLTQSLAIIEYLDEIHPTPPLLPADPLGRARVRSIAQMVTCDIHPLDNLRVLNYLRQPLGHNEDQVASWYNHWITEGFEAIEARLIEDQAGLFCHGNTLTLADICLVPQIVNADRFGLDLSSFPRILALAEAALRLPAVARALPEVQSDAE